MKNFSLLVIGSIFWLSQATQAQIVIDEGKTCVVFKIEDEKVPFPLLKANTKFELA